jgi:hypothetical protein
MRSGFWPALPSAPPSSPWGYPQTPARNAWNTPTAFAPQGATAFAPQPVWHARTPPPLPTAAPASNAILWRIAITMSMMFAIAAGSWLISAVQQWRAVRTATTTDATAQIESVIRDRANDAEHRSMMCLGPATNVSVVSVHVEEMNGDGRTGRARARVGVLCTRGAGAPEEVDVGLSFRYERAVNAFTLSDAVSFAPAAVGDTLANDLRHAQRDNDGPFAMYGFSLRAGETVTFRVEPGPSNRNVAQRAGILLAIEHDGHVLAHTESGEHDATLTIVAPESGEYRVGIEPTDLDDVGTFTLTSQHGAARP